MNRLNLYFLFWFLRIAVPFSLGTSQEITYCHPVKTRTNYCHFKSPNILKESPLVNNPITIKVSAAPKGEETDATDAKTPPSLEVFADDENMESNTWCSNAQLHLFKPEMKCVGIKKWYISTNTLSCLVPLCYHCIGQRLVTMTTMNVKRTVPRKKEFFQK